MRRFAQARMSTPAWLEFEMIAHHFVNGLDRVDAARRDSITSKGAAYKNTMTGYEVSTTLWH